MLTADLGFLLKTQTIWENWGKWFAAQRRAADLTQMEVAKKAGLERTHLSDIENGKTGSKRETVRKLMLAIHSSADEVEEGLRRAGFNTPSELTYEMDEDEIEAMSYYRGIPPELQPNAKELLRQLMQVDRKLNEGRIIGKRTNED